VLIVDHHFNSVDVESIVECRISFCQFYKTAANGALKHVA